LQTTLLGLAIAFIIALLGALIGPHFIDWNTFRPQFEAEASRVLGTPVHVSGQLDARLLPTPTLHLRSVSVGAAKDARELNADKLDVEFSLSSAMRGELRASELSLDGFSVELGLDKQGRVVWPFSGSRINTGSLTIDRLNLAGRVNLYDAGSATSIQLDDFRFSGDVRAVAGTARGEGSFRISDTYVPFRVSSGQSADGKGTRMRLSLDPGDLALFADLDGVLTRDAVPAFTGTLTLARPEKPDGNDNPWRITSLVKADPSSAKFEQVEAIYGPEENALRFSGAGDMRFGVSPLLKIALSAHQIDADRLLKNSVSPVSADLFSLMRRAIAQLPRAQVPLELQLSADQIALGNRPVQNVATELRGDKSAWIVKKFEIRAPGATQISANGTISQPGTGAAAFTGPVSVDSTDLELFSAWLQRRGEMSSRAQMPMRIGGNVTIAPDRLGIDGLKAAFGENALSGRVSLANLRDGKTRLDAALYADSLNLDMAGAIVNAVNVPLALPDEAKVSLDIGKAIVAGQEIRPVAVEFTIDGKMISLDRLSAGGTGAISINGSGSLDRVAANGKFTLDATAPSLTVGGDFVKPWAPEVSARLKMIDDQRGNVRIRATATLERAKEQSLANTLASLDFDSPPLNGSIAIRVASALDPAQGIDLAALLRGNASAEIKFSSAKSSAMLSLLGLDQVLSAQDGAAEFQAKLEGRKGAPLDVSAKLKGDGLDGDIAGTVDPWSADMKANVKLAARSADLSALIDLKPGAAQVQALSSRLNASGKTLNFGDLDAIVGGSRTHGWLKAVLGENLGIDGDVETDALNLPTLLAAALGTAGCTSGDPLGRGLMKGWRGSLALKSAKANLPNIGELQPFSSNIENDGQSLTFEGKGNLGGGEVRAKATARRISDGTSVSLSLNAADVDGAALRYRALAMPEGKSSFQATLDTQGRSAAALVGALSGSGIVTLTDAQIAGLNPQAFEAAVRASDAAQPTDDINLKSVVEPVLTAGKLSVPAATIPFTVKEGRILVEPTALEAPRTRLTVSGGYDLAADQMDARAILSAAVAKPATRRPEIRIDLNGSPDKSARSIDVTSLSSWLVMRSIDRQTQQLDRLERGGSSVPEPKPISLEEDLPQVEPIPKAEVRLPHRDPRKRNAGAKTAASASAALPPPAAQSAVNSAPLQVPAIAIKPAPGAPKLPKPHPPIVLTPSSPGTSSF
jgi:large subunit ribosomal protein L24